MQGLSVVGAQERVVAKAEYPLLSCRDVRPLISVLLPAAPEFIAKRTAQMALQHQQRQQDIDRHDQRAASG
ncbi:MAG: hypothetical protein EA400_08725 [Chromatiaceae bacterium]|nr:MAG: hypothetical protein EA400_08725 [Chromatiaceae bacterium]